MATAGLTALRPTLATMRNAPTAGPYVGAVTLMWARTAVGAVQTGHKVASMRVMPGRGVRAMPRLGADGPC